MVSVGLGGHDLYLHGGRSGEYVVLGADIGSDIGDIVARFDI